MKKNAVLIISGYNHRGVIAFCRFCRSYSIPFYIIAAHEHDLIFLSDYRKNVIYTRKEKELSNTEFAEYRNRIVQNDNYHKIVILPSTEYLNRFLLNNREQLENSSFLIPLTDRVLYEGISDKQTFGQMCKDSGITVPEEYERIDKNNIPFVAKPRKYFTNTSIVNEKPILVLTEKEYDTLKEKMQSADLYYQEFVEGKSFYLLYYFNRKGSYKVYSQQNLIQQANGLSIIAARSSAFHQKSITNQFADFFLKKGFSGLIMVEVKDMDGKIYMIEANPRLWGPSQLILDSGMDLFHQFAFDFELLDESNTLLPRYHEGTNYFWSGGIFEDQYNYKEIAFHEYGKGYFLNEYKDWMLSDVYLKRDTLDVYFKELNNRTGQ